MFDAPIAFAFTAGLIAVVNPCGFAMLPAYLSYFLGIESRNDDGSDPRGSLSRALATGAVVSLGFFVVFGVMGALFTLGLTALEDQLPWFGLVIGIVMFLLGIAMLRGFQMTVALPKLQKGGGGRDLRSLFLFGISYAIASLSCAFPTFFALFGLVDGAGAGTTVFVAYALGMTTVLMALTVSLAMARQSLLHTLRKAMQHVDKAAGVLLVIAGAYIVYFWSIDLAEVQSGSAWREPVLLVERFSDGIRNRIRDAGGTRVGLVLGAIVAASIGSVLIRPRREPSRTEETTAV